VERKKEELSSRDSIDDKYVGSEKSLLASRPKAHGTLTKMEMETEIEMEMEWM
jgi:hypothetical protein